MLIMKKVLLIKIKLKLINLKKKVFGNITTIINLIEKFIHPGNEGYWTKDLLLFLKNFINAYVMRNKKENSIKNKNENLMDEKKKVEDENNDLNSQIFNEDDLEDIYKEENNEDEEDDKDEEDEDDENEEEFVKKENTLKKENFLDEKSHEKFFDIIKKSLKYVILLRGKNGNSVGTICLVIFFVIYFILNFFLK